MRQPIVAGQFYPEDKIELERQVKSFLKIKQEKSIKAAIVPHAGYVFSGKCAGKVYSSLPSAETYVILGVNHNGLGEDIAVSTENFQMPLGEVRNDVTLSKKILSLLEIKEDNLAHKYEHSIEVQLPFLQLTKKNFKIVPIILKNYNIETCQKLAKAIIKSAGLLDRKLVVLASSDFTHTGPSYHFQGDINIDKRAIDEILKLHAGKFLEIAEKTTICGAGAIATTIEYAKLAGAKKGKLLEYYDSSSVMPSENKVGYGGVVFY